MAKTTPTQATFDMTQENHLQILEARFRANPQRHPQITWEVVLQRLGQSAQILDALWQMEATGGEPDVVQLPEGLIAFVDCAKESPIGRRSLCYDQTALDDRKENKPASSALQMAQSMGIQILDEAQYRALQDLTPVDLKTSSWIETPKAIRSLGGALFCDRRYNAVFTYHNGAESYYAARGFRGILKI